LPAWQARSHCERSGPKTPAQRLVQAEQRAQHCDPSSGTLSSADTCAEAFDESAGTEKRASAPQADIDTICWSFIALTSATSERPARGVVKARSRDR
jgi:hypothetical protein